MKKSDWALIILIVAVVGVISWFVIGGILPAPEDESVKTAPEITASIDAPANNVMLYAADRPSWCPLEVDDSINNESTDEENDENNEDENNTSNTDESNSDENSSNTTDSEGKQAINASFNSCAINSSFTTTTE